MAALVCMYVFLIHMESVNNEEKTPNAQKALIFSCVVYIIRE